MTKKQLIEEFERDCYPFGEMKKAKLLQLDFEEILKILSECRQWNDIDGKLIF